MTTTTTAIKITALADIGNAISPSTVIPVVNLQGMPTSQKANLQITGNLILAGAGSANFVPAGLANLAYSVTNSAQPNITSVGTLTSLSVTGNVGTGNIIATGNINSTGNSSLGNSVTANYFIGDGHAIINVGSISNGTSNVFVNPSSNVTISSNGNANVVVVTGTGAIVSGNLRGTQIISNAISSNNYGNIHVSAGASSWIFTNTGNLTLPGNTWQVNYANGTQVPIGGGGSSNTIQDGPSLAYIDGVGGNFVVSISDSDSVWSFGVGGDITFPGGSVQHGAYGGPDFPSVGSNGGKYLTTDGTQLLWSTVAGGYGNSNVATFLASYGSNTISTTGNVKTGLLIAPASDNGSIIFSTNGTDNNGSLKVDGGLNMTINANSNYYVKQNGSDRLAITTGNTDLMGATDVVLHSNKAGTEFQWVFDSSGILSLPEVTSASAAVIQPASNGYGIDLITNGNTWSFGTDGNFAAPGSGYFAGQNLFVGSGSNSLPFTASTLVISADNSEYIQAVVTNVSDIGSADWVAYGHRGNDNGGWIDMGFTSSGFSDANYTITGQGDGYVLVNSFYEGQAPGGAGGNLVLATGNNGTVNDIVFATNGFLTNNEFGRISSSNNALQFTSGGNITGANVITANAFTTSGSSGNITGANVIVANYFSGDGSNISNVPINWTTAPVSNTSAGIQGQAAYDAGGNLFICVATNMWSKITGTTSW